MAAKAAVIGAEGGDPRLMLDEKELDVLGAPGYATYTKPHMRKLHDPSVTFEEYHHYALKTREDEEANAALEAPTGIVNMIIPSKQTSKGVGMDERRASIVPQVNTSDKAQRVTITEEEWINASRSVRTASMGAVFYLITTDVLGPFGLPYAFALTGYGPGVALYTVFGALAAYSATLIWQSFMGLDSFHYPLRNYGDIAYRLWGGWARYFFNFLQIVQLVGAVGLIVISNGEALSEISQFKLCYAVCCLIWAIVGCALGQIRTFQKLGWLATVSLWLNLLLIFITMGVAAHSDPLYSAYPASAGYAYNPDIVTPYGPNNETYPAIQKTAGLPDPSSFSISLVGLAQAIYAYGGAMVFTELMAEMKRPRDFLKAVWSAQAVIYVAYMLYGLFMYSYQGQYVQNPSYLGINGYAWQTVGNVLAIITALIAAALYGNVGLKVIYNHVLMELFNAPPLTQTKGKLLWVFLIPTYWIIAYIIAAAIPAFSAFAALLSSACVLPITYVFPPFLSLAFETQKNAIRPEMGEGFNAETGETVRHDTGIRRLVRGYLSGGAFKVSINIWHTIYLLGAMALWGMGMYAGIEALIGAYEGPTINAFACQSPVDSS